MNERNLIPEAIEYLSKSDEERILYCKKDHWIGYGAAVKLIEILEDKFLDPPQMRHEGLLIYGDSNNGKTAILKRMYELHKTKLDYVTKDRIDYKKNKPLSNTYNNTNDEDDSDIEIYPIG